MNKDSIAYQIALEVDKLNGKTYYVGGYVRDHLLKIKNDDVDIEVHGITYEQLKNILNKIDQPIAVGKSFGIFTLKNYNIDIALPRKEFNTGKGHKDFEIFIDPYIGTLKAAKRRDFTINSLMMDVLSEEIIDHFNGSYDLQNKIIRHIDDSSFVEDPLRVLRACQFSARFEFEIAKETIDLCSKIDISTLSSERIETETNKALLKANKPSIFFENLRRMNQLHYWFEPLEKLIGLKQDAIYHPEGDVWTHTMMVLDEAVKYRDKSNNPLEFMYLCLSHDLGKIDTTIQVNDRIHAYEHENVGEEIIRKFLNKFISKNSIVDYVCKMSKLHMLPNKYASDKSAIKKTNKMFYDAIDSNDLIYFALCDHPLKEPKDERYEFLLERLQIYNDMIKKPYVTGKDLIDNGLKPNEDFSKLLDYALKLRLAGVDYQSALKQTLAYKNNK